MALIDPNYFPNITPLPVPNLGGFRITTPSGIAYQKQLAKEGKLWYVYPDSGVSQWSGAGAEGPFTLEEAQKRQATIRSNLRTTTHSQISAPPPASTSVPSSTTGSSPPNITNAASQVAAASKPVVPQFVTPYVKPSGPGAFGESDVNPFYKNKKMF